MTDGSRKAIIAAFFANLGIALATFESYSLRTAVLAIETKGLLIGARCPGTSDRRRWSGGGSSAPPSSRPVSSSSTTGSSESAGAAERGAIVAAKEEFAIALPLTEPAAAIDRIEPQIRAAVPMARLIYLEPDVHRAAG